MKLVLPLFVQLVQWRRLARAERNGKPWKYLELQDVCLWFAKPIGLRTYYCYSSDGKLRMIIGPNYLIIKAGYAWNGSTCAPDMAYFDRMLLASLFHDGLYQFSGVPGFPKEITRQVADEIYRTIAVPVVDVTYYFFLRVFGWTCWPQNVSGCKIIIE